MNPAKPSEVVGIHQKAGAEHVEPAMQAALHAFESWSVTPWEIAPALLFRTAEIIRQRRFEFDAWLVFEVAKNFAEADADICETIDFLEFYAREALRLSTAEPAVQLPGERDTLQYIPLGVGAVHSAVEFSRCDYGGHDGRRGCLRQHRDPETFQ